MPRVNRAKIPTKKSHLLAYLKHTTGLELRIEEFKKLSVNRILERMRNQLPLEHGKIIERLNHL